MTLLVNEIHVPGDLRQGNVLFAADRRITMPGKSRPKFMKKIMEIKYLNAGIGYYGLAQVNQSEYFSGWLPNFIKNSVEAKSLRDFATKLHGELNRKVNKVWLREKASGFHICGYNADNFPELWHICNHQMEGNNYVDLVSEYHLSEDFLRRDAPNLGFDGINSIVPQPFVQYYVNGDVRPFHSVWKRLDEFLFEMFSHKDFKHPARPDEYIEVIRWKMEVVASFYQKFARKPIIGKPIDAFIILPKGEKYH